MTQPIPIERWDCHAHRDELKVSTYNTVFHPERGQLCYGERRYDGILYYPLEFKDKTAAYKWIASGNIGEIQESLGNLQVAFTCQCFIPRT